LGANESTKVKIKVQRVVDGKRGVVQVFKTLVNARNEKYECVSKLLDGEASKNSQNRRKFEVCKAALEWCANTCEKVPKGFVEIIIEHPSSFSACNHN
jgi:hypothetical protein